MRQRCGCETCVEWWCDHANCLEELDECFLTEAAMREHQRVVHGVLTLDGQAKKFLARFERNLQEVPPEEARGPRLLSSF